MPANVLLQRFIFQKNILLWVGICLFCVIFFFSAATKFAALSEFENSLRLFEVFPYWLLPYIKFFIPLFEIILVPLLFFRRTRRLSLYFSFVILSLFTSLIIVTLISGAQISCSCFGNLSNQPIGISTLIRNSILLFIGALLLWIDLGNNIEMSNVKINIGKTEFFSFITLFVLCASFVLVGALTLIQQNSIYKERINLLLRSYYLAPNQKAPNLFLYSTKDSVFSVALNDYPAVVIFIMKYKCKPCEMIQPFWNSLVPKYPNIKFIGLLNDSLKTYKEYSKKTETLFPLYYVTSSTKSNYKILATPETIIIRNDTIIQVYEGLLNNQEKAELQLLLHQFTSL